MISEAQELYVEGLRVSHSWWICAVSHGHGGLGGVGMEVVDGLHAGQRLEGWSHVGRCQNTSRAPVRCPCSRLHSTVLHGRSADTSR